LAEELGDSKDMNAAGRIAIAVLHAIRERIRVKGSMHLIARLPIILKGIYEDGMGPGHEVE
jgi:uncharacterized protein (DUF2267 family)